MSTFDILKTYVPINKQAKKEFLQYPEEFKVKITQVQHFAPLPMRSITNDMKRNGNFLDLTGSSCEYLTVVGFFAEKRKKHCLWVCRCVCGTYLTRTPKAIKRWSGANSNDKCQSCKKTDFLKNKKRNNS